MHTAAVRLVGFLVLGCLGGVAVAAPQDAGPFQAGSQYDDQGQPAWQRRVEAQERAQRQQERDQEWQRQQQEELRRQAEAQQRSNEAWQRQNEAWQRQQEWELRRRAAEQRRSDAAWQRQQEEIINRQAEAQGRGPVYDTGRHRWHRGNRYAGPMYVVQDWHRQGLRTPPGGYQWVQAEGGYLLVAIGTGVILDVVGD